MKENSKKEKVLKGLRTCKKSISCSLKACEKCPYQRGGCAEKLYADAIELLESGESGA